MREISLLEAKCASCGQLFGHPSLGDFSYGEVILSTEDGKHFATADAFGDFAERVRALVKLNAEASFWPALASLADPISGQSLTHSICCPHCGSKNLEYWGGERTGFAAVPAATFSVASLLSPKSLAERLGVTGLHQNEA